MLMIDATSRKRTQWIYSCLIAVTLLLRCSCSLDPIFTPAISHTPSAIFESSSTTADGPVGNPQDVVNSVGFMMNIITNDAGQRPEFSPAWTGGESSQDTADEFEKSTSKGEEPPIAGLASITASPRTSRNTVDTASEDNLHSTQLNENPPNFDPQALEEKVRRTLKSTYEEAASYTESSSDEPNGTTTTGNYPNYVPPRNITDAFKGTWRLDPSLAFATGLDFAKREGHAVFQLVTKPSPAPSIDLVKGDLMLRDGVYSTDANRRFSLQGVYLWREGSLFLIANPVLYAQLSERRPYLFDESEPVLHDLVLVIENDTTIEQIIEKSERLRSLAVAGEDTVPYDEEDEGCYLKMLFRAKPIPSELNKDSTQLTPLELEKRRQMMEWRGIIESPNCRFSMSAEAAPIIYETFYAKAMNYVVMVLVASILQIWLLKQQMRHTNTIASTAKVSLLTIGVQAIFDSYLCLIHLTVGIIVETLFNAFALAAFFMFVTFSVFEMRYLLSIWKARRPNTFANGWQSVRRELSLLYARFYFFLMIGFVLVYYVSWMFRAVLFVMFSFWIPQIACNAMRDQKNALSKSYIIGTSLTRLAIPIYFYVCPVNFLHIEPRPLFALALVGHVAAQALILFLQDSLNPRFFIPSIFLPEKYNYFRPLATVRWANLEEGGGGAFECVICMSSVDSHAHDHMIAPCDHVFHARCLEQWMTYKMECPTCRRPLPNP